MLYNTVRFILIEKNSIFQTKNAIIIKNESTLKFTSFSKIFQKMEGNFQNISIGSYYIYSLS